VKERIVLLGASLHAKYTTDILEKQGKYEIAGFTDPYKEVGSDVYGYRVIGRQEDILKIVDKYGIKGGVICIGDNWIRKIVYDAIIERMPDFRFVSAIHPATVIARDVEIGRGTVIMAGVIINTGARIGECCFLATNSSLEHDCIMEDFSSISAGVVTGGKLRIGRYSAICLGATLLDRIDIGEHVVVGAGSLVMQDLPDNVLAYGRPAKVVRGRAIGEKYLK
jgi:sugar O-acyltransferase (sialic acid O-acetyltransferase NeuD family)